MQPPTFPSYNSMWLQELLYIQTSGPAIDSQVRNLLNVAAHKTVNYSVQFVTPSGVHTQNVESYWNRAKIKIRKMRGCAAQEVPSYLDEFMWRVRFGKTTREAMDSIIHDIALYEIPPCF